MKETNRNRANVAKRRARQRKLRNRRIALTVCLMLVVMVASIGGTVAWLTDKTTPVVNTFSPSNIGLTLDEVNNPGHSYKMVPGVTLAKDPKVTITNDVNAWLFVKVDKSTNLDNFIEYSFRDVSETGWKWGTGETGDGVPTNVLYRTVAADATTKEWYLLTGDADNANGCITVKSTVTKTDMSALDNASKYPTLTFKAYAIQQEGFDTAAAAWAEASK